MAQHKLSARRVETLNKRGHYGDGGNLYLQISQWHTKSWTFRYKLHGKIKEMGLGPLVLISLAEARDKALACRKLLLEGRDPIAARQHQREQAKLEAAKTITFAQCADSYIKAAEDGWRNQQHRYQWRQTIKAACDTKLGRSAGGTFGDLPVAKVDTGFVLQVLQPIWKVKPETASRTRQRIETVLNWATASEYRQGENPARWRGHLEHKLVKPRKLHSVQHHPALPYTDVPEFMTELRSDKSVAAKALEFTILSASRTGEVINASWNEIDMRAKTWTVPAKRMKSGKAHRVPLTDVALTLLSSLPRKRDNPFVFISGAKPLRAVAMLDSMTNATYHTLTTDDFRILQNF